MNVEQARKIWKGSDFSEKELQEWVNMWNAEKLKDVDKLIGETVECLFLSKESSSQLESSQE